MSKAIIQEKYSFNEDEDLINSGAFGQIFRIKDKNVKTEYVLKKIVKSKTDPESFKNEIDFLKEIKGTNIINIIDYFSDKNDKFYYIILEKMDGDLNEMLKANNNKMTSNMIRKIFKQLNSAFKIMYTKQKCHRDLKPDNILYSYTNDDKTDFIVKLGDFGLATDLYVTQSTDAGTYIYKAPEIGTEKHHTNKCDLYSIGVILYKLKTGEFIFEGKNMIDYLINKKNGKLKKTKNNKLIDDDDNLNDLISNLVVNAPDMRLKWNDYFNHPFFKENDNQKLINDNNFLKNKNINCETEIQKLNDQNKQLNETNNKLNSGIIFYM